MDFTVILEYVLGPLGTLVFALLFIFSVLTRRYFVPLWVYEKSEERVSLLDAENSELNGAVVALKEELASVRSEVQYLNRELQDIRSRNV